MGSSRSEVVCENFEGKYQVRRSIIEEEGNTYSQENSEVGRREGLEGVGADQQLREASISWTYDTEVAQPTSTSIVCTQHG
jgi:hypothetical protein